jgi:voltage-gated potassium channel
MGGTLPLQLLIGVSMVVFTLVVHVAGLAGLLALIPQHGKRLGMRRTLLAEAAMILVVANALFFLHLFEILAYAVLFLVTGAIRSFPDALLFSTATYATFGSEVSVAHAWRLLPAIEAANGVILLGWSTAFFVSVLARIRTLQEEWRD